MAGEAVCMIIQCEESVTNTTDLDAITIEHERAAVVIMTKEPGVSRSTALTRALRIMLQDERERITNGIMR